VPSAALGRVDSVVMFVSKGYEQTFGKPENRFARKSYPPVTLPHLSA